MAKAFVVLAAVLLLAISAESTHVDPCVDGKGVDSIKSVTITNCEEPPCKLKRRTKIAIEQKFVPPRDVKSLTTSVSAKLFNVPLPFIGVDGTDACHNIYNADGSKAGCPLKGGNEYYYKNEFPVLEFYPKVSLVVYWALTEGNNKITCFEVPSKITG